MTHGTRPVTGHLLVGGDFYKHTGYGIQKSWLGSEKPEEYLFAAGDFGRSPVSFGSRFVRPAMDAFFPDLLLDIPMARDNGALKMSQGVTILFLPEGSPWTDAQYITTLTWKDHLEVKGPKHKNWRKWNETWFRAHIRRALTEEMGTLEKQLIPIQTQLALLKRMTQTLE